HDPHDSILAAARYLVRNGAPYNMRNAIFQYNHDYDYVDAVESFARAYRTDPGWLDRMYYWNTFGWPRRRPIPPRCIQRFVSRLRIRLRWRQRSVIGQRERPHAIVRVSTHGVADRTVRAGRGR